MGEVKFFDKTGAENTQACLDLAKRRADELGIDTIVLASTKGNTALEAGQVFAGKKLVVVTHSHGFKGADTQEMPVETRRKLEERGIAVLTTTHALGGVGRSIRRKFNTYQVDEVIANTLRVFGEGTKVCCEIVLMAADSGLIRTDGAVMAIAGTDSGADTALVIRPANTQDFFNLKVSEIVCKPRL